MAENTLKIKNAKAPVSSKGLKIGYDGTENLKGRVAKSKYFANAFDSKFGAESSESKTADSNQQFCDISLECIAPRSINQYSQTRIDKLARSIRATNNRLIHPITVVRVEDLDPNGEVIQKFLQNGVDIDTLQYVIVDGERRFRAFSQLKAEEDAKDHSLEIGWRNPFGVITCNILSSEEALNEKIFYEDSNTQARQLTPEEALQLIIESFDDIRTEAEARDDAELQKALDEINAHITGIRAITEKLKQK